MTGVAGDKQIVVYELLHETIIVYTLTENNDDNTYFTVIQCYVCDDVIHQTDKLVSCKALIIYLVLTVV